MFASTGRKRVHNPGISAYGYYGNRDPVVYAYYTDEKRFLTPDMRPVVDAPPRAR